MIKKFYENNKFIDYLNIKSFEVRGSILIAIISLIIMYFIDFYENFNLFCSNINDYIFCFIGGYIGLLGLVFAGVVYISGVFTPDFVNAIEKCSEKKLFDKVMCSFEFNAFNICIEVFILVIFNLLINSNLEKPSPSLFYFSCFVFIYTCFFNLFYSVSLVHNCIRLNGIRNGYYKLESKQEKDFYALANEIRIDLLIATIINDKKDDIDLVRELENHINLTNYSKEVKDKLNKYFSVYYKK